jgi:hypothetical protein
VLIVYDLNGHLISGNNFKTLKECESTCINNLPPLDDNPGKILNKNA